MSVLLIHPALLEFEPNKEFTPPLSILYLSGVLQGIGAEVEILDISVYRPWESELGFEKFSEKIVMQKIAELEPSLVGFNCFFSGQFPLIINLSERIKELNERIQIAVGGMHPTIYAKDIITNCPTIDYVAIGEGEEQMVAITQAAQCDKSLEYLSSLDGIAYRDNGNVIVNPKRQFIENLDALPCPAYNLIDFEDYYHPVSHWHNPKNLSFNMTFPIISSRSCPNRCNFCSNYLSMGSKLRVVSPQKVVDEIQLLYDRYGQNHFSFMDDNINMNKKHIISICNEIVRKKLNIQFETPNGLYLAALDHEVIDSMVEAGWVRGALAIESGSELIRNKVMGKHLSQEKIYEVARICKIHEQLYLKGAFMIGMPEETPQTLMDTYNLIMNLNLDEVFMTNLMPYPGTRVFEQAHRDGLLTEEIELDSLWRTTGFHYHNNKKFYVKPYNMEIEELEEYRRKFDDLIDRMKNTRNAIRPKEYVNG